MILKNYSKVIRKEDWMEKKDVVDFLKKEDDIDWLEKLNKFIYSHIEFLKAMSELESH